MPGVLTIRHVLGSVLMTGAGTGGAAVGRSSGVGSSRANTRGTRQLHVLGELHVSQAAARRRDHTSWRRRHGPALRHPSSD